MSVSAKYFNASVLFSGNVGVKQSGEARRGVGRRQRGASEAPPQATLWARATQRCRRAGAAAVAYVRPARRRRAPATWRRYRVEPVSKDTVIDQTKGAWHIWRRQRYH